MIRFEIVIGRTNEGERVFRVVEYAADGTCLGGRGSFFKLTDAEAWIVKERQEA